MRDDVPRLHRRTAQEILGRGNKPHDVHRQIEPGCRLDRADDRRGSAHVHFHFRHSARGLDRNPAAVEGNPFADQNDRIQIAARGVVFEDDEPGRFVASGIDRQQTTEAGPFDFFLVPDLRPVPVAPGGSARGFGERLGINFIGGGVLKVPGERDRLAEDPCFPDPASCGIERRPVGREEDQLPQPDIAVLFFSHVAVELVQ